MPMSRKHYEVVAKVLRNNRSINAADPSAGEIIDGIVGDLAVEFALDNPRFDEGRFVRACEVQR